MAEVGRKAQKLSRAGSSGDAATKDQITTLRKDAFKQAAALLNPDQQKAWQSLIGEPFQLRTEQRPGRQQSSESAPQADPFSFDDDDDL